MWGIVQGLEKVAMVAEAQGDVKRAARLLGAVERLRHATDASLAPPEKAAPECLLAAVRAALGEAAFAAAWAAGREMSLDDAIVFALEGSSSSPGEGE
jgi:hypothetical protein